MAKHAVTTGRGGSVNHNRWRSWIFRFIARLLVPGQVLSLPTASFAQNAQEKSKPVAAPRQEAVPPPPVKVNRTVPAGRPPSAFPQFSPPATDRGTFQARGSADPREPR